MAIDKKAAHPAVIRKNVEAVGNASFFHAWRAPIHRLCGVALCVATYDKDAAQAVADEIAKAGGIAMAMDVTSEDQVNAAVAEVVATYGGVDVLVSNAGIQIVHPIEEFPFADWKKMLAIHLDGAFLTTKACMPHMQASGKNGSIIYMGPPHWASAKTTWSRRSCCGRQWMASSRPSRMWPRWRCCSQGSVPTH